MNERVVALDIETVSQGKKAVAYTEKYQKFKTGNVKDPVKLEAKIGELKAKALGEHGLSWVTGKVISCALVDMKTGEEEVYAGHDEREVLLQVLEATRSCQIWGKTSKNFDFPFLVGRYMALELPLPSFLKIASRQGDVDTFFGWSTASTQRSTLDSYAYALDLDMKTMKGSAVQSLYDQIIMAESSGDMKRAEELWGQLKEYNLGDSRIVRHMYNRYNA